MRRAWLEIDLEAYRCNLRKLTELCEVPVLAVIKANAYGHGLVPIAREAARAGCAGAGVALVEEGARLREGGFGSRIVLLGLCLEEEASAVVQSRLEPTVSRLEAARALSNAGLAAGAAVPLHVKVDTGMGRAGIDPADLRAFLAALDQLPGVRLAGVATHVACADSADAGSVMSQQKAFAPLVELVRRRSPGVIVHASNSAAALRFPNLRFDWVRCGLATYGVAPGPGPLPDGFRAVASLRTRVVQVKGIPAGRSVGYGWTWTAPAASRIALLPLGYADGYPWNCGNHAEVLIAGRRAPVRGRICMDQMMIEVPRDCEVAPGDEAVLVGRQGDDEITVDEVAGWAGTISYEILTRWSDRLERVYANSEAAG